MPEYGADLQLVDEAFWRIRNTYDGKRPVPIHGIRDGLEALGLLEEVEWMMPRLLAMDAEFGAFVAAAQQR